MGQSEFKARQGCTVRYCLRKEREKERRKIEITFIPPTGVTESLSGFCLPVLVIKGVRRLFFRGNP